MYKMYGDDCKSVPQQMDPDGVRGFGGKDVIETRQKIFIPRLYRKQAQSLAFAAKYANRFALIRG